MENKVTLVTNANDFQACVAVRAAAFLARGEPYKEEYDGNDLISATHLLAKRGDEPVGTMRIRIISADQGGVAVWERLAITSAGNRGIGILNSLANTARIYTSFKGCHRVLTCVSDPRLIRFWEKRGFRRNNLPPVIYNNNEYTQIELSLIPDSPMVDLHMASENEAVRFENILCKGETLSTVPIRSCA